MARKPPVASYQTTVTPDDLDHTDTRVRFYSGVPRENRTDDSRLAERALLQGAKSGLLDDRLANDAKESDFF